MEKSHYQARTSFFRSTRHGGGQIRSNALKELFNQFYRRQLQRSLTKQHENGEPVNEDCIVEENIEIEAANEDCTVEENIDIEPTNDGNIDQEYMDIEPTNENFS